MPRVVRCGFTGSIWIYIWEAYFLLRHKTPLDTPGTLLEMTSDTDLIEHLGKGALNTAVHNQKNSIFPFASIFLIWQWFLDATRRFLSLAMLIYGNALIEAQKLTPNSVVQKDSKSYSSFMSIFSLGQRKILNHLESVMCHFSNLLQAICSYPIVLISSLKVCRGREFPAAFFPSSVLCATGEGITFCVTPK